MVWWPAPRPAFAHGNRAGFGEAGAIDAYAPVFPTFFFSFSPV